jgi:CheY-like chemotaxis protein
MQRLAQIMFAHARRNPYRYQVTNDGRLDHCDVALVDMTVQGNDRLLRVLKRRAANIVVLTVGRRGAADREADDLLLTQFHTRLLAVLNQAVTPRLGPLEPAVRLNAPGSSAAAPTPSRLGRPASSASVASEVGAVGAVSAVSAMRTVWGRAPRALVLDPSPTARMQLMSRLTSAGWEVQGASTLTQSKVWLSTWPVDVVVSDWMLEDGPSVQLQAVCRSASALRGGPADWVLLTRRLGWWDALQARLAGCAGVLDKPATPQALLGLTDRLLRERLSR